MITTETSHLSTVISIILNSYFSSLTTTCILWNKDFDFSWPSEVNFNVQLYINPWTLNETFSRDIYNFTEQDEQYHRDGIFYDDWIKKYVAAIANTKCEGYVVFQNDIPRFAQTYRKASVYSIWRSYEPKFLFIYTKENQKEDYFQDLLFKNAVNILAIEAEYKNATHFNIKRNKFVGSVFGSPHELLKISKFDALTRTFEPNVDLYSLQKLQNLQQREIIVGVFDYRPLMVVDYHQRLPETYDHAADNPRHLVHANGTEMRIVHGFCELYNCSVQVDTSEKVEWGQFYQNYTANGLLGMIVDGKTEMALGGMFTWHISYRTIDQSTFIGRSGVTCLVPKPTRISTWALPISPFTYTLWLGVMFCLFWETMALFSAKYFEERVVTQADNPSLWSSFEFGFTTTLKLFISQSSRREVISQTIRVILFACYMIDIIVTSIYAGGLSSILTLPTLEEAADSVERLYSHNLSWTATSYDWITLIADDDLGIIDPKIHQIVTNYRISTREEMRKKAKTENLGFAVERMAFGHFGNSHFLTPEARNHLKLMVDDIYYVFTVAMVPRMWPHLPKYNDFILAWHSSGMSKYWEWKMVADYMNANEQNQVMKSMYNKKDAGPIKLDMKNFAGLIVPWLVGMIMSMVVFAVEWFHYWWNKKRGNRVLPQP
ncbi:uncharacterized protein [Musca autumnalis]|uniref:uncharacterized protein n=1 Tax=Musca autumnalis TaxID=221902 RepID=UPI003CE79362